MHGSYAPIPKTASPTDFSKLNAFTIQDALGRKQTLYIGKEKNVRESLDRYELPPAAMGFDARFASKRMVETYPSQFTQGSVYEYPINIESPAYPLTVQWSIVDEISGRSEERRVGKECRSRW